MPTMTYLDAVQHLVDYLGGNASAETQREVRRAVPAALREIAAAFKWSCLFTRGWINVHENYESTSAITLAYTHSSRTFTLTGGTWPTWAGDGVLRISPTSGKGDYPIFRRTGDTTLIADTTINPGQNVASGTAFQLYQNVFSLPEDFRSMGMIYPGSSIARPATAASNHEANRLFGSVGTPYQFTPIQDHKRPGRMALHLLSWPSVDDTVAFMYLREARALKYTGIATRDRVGTVTVDGTAVTGSGTAFESGQVGSIFRAYSTDQEWPTDQAGDFPYAIEDVITAVDSATSLTLLENTTDLTNAVKYTISDPIDLSVNLYNVFLRCCEKQGEIVRQRQGKGDVMAIFADALADAKIADQREFTRKALGGVSRTSRDELQQWEPFTDV